MNRTDYLKLRGHELSLERIPDECGRREMTWAQYKRHIERCSNQHCREVWQNHQQLANQLAAKASSA